MSTQRVAVVTGASSGFGRMTAEALAAAGYRVYATMRNVATKNAAAAGALRSAGIAVVELDVLDDASVTAAAGTIIAEAGAPDVLVNNAGNAFFGVVEAFAPQTVEKQFQTNVFGPLRVNRAFLPAMREHGSGLIVYVSSVVGRLTMPFGGVYAASKWALEALAESSSYELAPFKIDVAIVQPGAYPTEIGEKRTGVDDAAADAAYAGLGHLQGALFGGLTAASEGRDPGDVARAILRLAEAAPGTRPLRTTVPDDAAVDAINAAVAPVQRQFLESLGLSELLGGVPV